MHRHDAHFVAPLLHVALDFGLAAPDLIDEALQRGRRFAVEGKRDIEKLVDRLSRFRSEPGEHGLAQALPVGAEQLRIELVRRLEVDA